MDCHSLRQRSIRLHLRFDDLEKRRDAETRNRRGLQRGRAPDQQRKMPLSALVYNRPVSREFLSAPLRGRRDGRALRLCVVLLIVEGSDWGPSQECLRVLERRLSSTSEAQKSPGVGPGFLTAREFSTELCRYATDPRPRPLAVIVGTPDPRPLVELWRGERIELLEGLFRHHSLLGLSG